MRQLLRRHPDTPCDAVEEIAVEVAPAGAGRLALVYRVRGDLDRLVLPPPAAPARADELWRTTCFEAFAQPAGGEAYTEFNFAPSGLWAAYRFDRYREGMRPAETEPPGVMLRRESGGLELAATAAVGAGALRLGLTAVIEEVGGRKSYWSLRHAAGAPDFHRADCFTFEIPAPLAP